MSESTLIGYAYLRFRFTAAPDSQRHLKALVRYFGGPDVRAGLYDATRHLLHFVVEAHDAPPEILGSCDELVVMSWLRSHVFVKPEPQASVFALASAIRLVNGDRPEELNTKMVSWLIHLSQLIIEGMTSREMTSVSELVDTLIFDALYPDPPKVA